MSTAAPVLRGGDGPVPTAVPGLVSAQSLLPSPDDATWPVPEPLRALLPGGGLRAGSTVRVEGSTSLLLALMAEVSRAGGWCGAVGLGSLNPAAAAEAGVDLDRLALVPRPRDSWPTVVAALLDAIDVVAVAPPAPGRAAAVARRLSARARERRGVLLAVGEWGASADVELSVLTRSWEGLGDGHGHLTTRTLEVRATGRRVAGPSRTARLHLGPPTGAVHEGVLAFDRRQQPRPHPPEPAPVPAPAPARERDLAR